MKQIIQNYHTGELEIVEVLVPALKKGFVLVQNVSSLEEMCSGRRQVIKN